MQSPPTPADAIVRVPSDEEAIYDSLLVAIAERTLRLATLEDEVAPLLRALERFETLYNSQLGGLQQELRDLRQQVQTIEHRTARIHARIVADPNHIMGDLFDEDELHEIGELFGVELPESWFESARESEERRRASAHGEDDESWGNDETEEEILRKLQGRRGQKPRLPEEAEQEIRSLHRSLARRFHPDLADTEAERAVCQEMMLRINAAWHDRDLDELRTIDEQSDYLDGGEQRGSFGRRIHWARQECARVDGRLRSVSERLASLRESTTFPLWFNPTLAQTVITQRASALRMDMAKEEQRLVEIKLAFRHALASYAAVVG